MNVDIEKISNGFVLTLNGKRIFCDVPEAVCGELAQWALAECENVKESTIDKVKTALELVRRQHELERSAVNPPWEEINCSPKVFY